MSSEKSLSISQSRRLLKKARSTTGNEPYVSSPVFISPEIILPCTAEQPIPQNEHLDIQLLDNSYMVPNAPVKLQKRMQESGLYEYSTVTREDALDLFFDIVRKCHLNCTAVEKLTQFIHSVLPDANGFPSSRYLLMSELDIRSESVVRHFICEDHSSYLGTDSSSKCSDCIDGIPSSFVTLDIRSALETLLSDEIVNQIVTENLEKDSHLGIHDGKRYKELSSGAEFSINFHVDGTPLQRKSLWMVQFSMNELPITHRFNFRRVALIFIGKSEPDIDLVLTPVVEQLLDIRDDGISWKSSSGQTITSRVVCGAVICDGPAKCKLQRMRQYNSRNFGCTLCLTSGEGVPEVKSITVYPHRPDTVTVSRTHEGYIEDCKAATKKLEGTFTTKKQLAEAEEGVNGVKGVSRFCLLPELDIIRDCIADPMHAFGNVCQQLLDILIDTTIDKLACAQSFNGRIRIITKDDIERIDDAMTDICFNSCVGRFPGKLSEYRTWKTNQLFQFFLVDVPLLFQTRTDQLAKLLNPDIRVLLLNLSAIMNTLLADQFPSTNDRQLVVDKRAELADSMCRDFVITATNLFGPRWISYQFHLILHMPQIYRDWGPLYSVSAFPYESGFGHYKQMAHGKKHVDLGLSKRILEREAILKRTGKRRNRSALRGPSKTIDHSDIRISEQVQIILACLKLDSAEVSIRLHQRGNLASGIRLETANIVHEPAVCNAFCALKDGRIVHLLHLLDIQPISQKDMRYEAAIAKVIKQTPAVLSRNWISQSEVPRKIRQLEYPAVIHTLPSSDDHLCVFGLDEISNWVVSVKGDDVGSGKFLVPALSLMPHD